MIESETILLKNYSSFFVYFECEDLHKVSTIEFNNSLSRKVCSVNFRDYCEKLDEDYFFVHGHTYKNNQGIYRFSDFKMYQKDKNINYVFFYFCTETHNKSTISLKINGAKNIRAFEYRYFDYDKPFYFEYVGENKIKPIFHYSLHDKVQLKEYVKKYYKKYKLIDNDIKHTYTGCFLDYAETIINNLK